MGKKKKIAFLFPNFSIGGAQKVALDILKALDDTTMEKALFVFGKKESNQFVDELLANKIPVIFLNMSGRAEIGNYWKLHAALKAYSPDVIHIHMDTIYAPLWSLLSRVRTVFTLHSQPYRTFDKKLLVYFHRFLAKQKYYELVAVSKMIAEEACDWLGLPQGYIKTIYNPVDIPEEAKRTETKQRFVNVARFHPVKNQKLLLAAFAEVHQKYPAAQLQIAGDGNLQLMEECKELAMKLGIEKNVSFLGNVKNVSQLLMDSDVLVLSSDSEALPVSVLEAMAHGLPIVSTNVGGISEIVTNNGILVDKGNAQALAEAMCRLLEDQEIMRICGERSFAHIQQHQPQKIAAEYTQLYMN